MRPRPDKPRVRLGTSILIVSPEERLLILQQEHEGAVDRGPPGGALEYGEDLEECAVREAFEETGLRVKLVRLLAVDQFWNGSHFEGIGFSFLAKPEPWPQKVSIPDMDGPSSFLAYQWVTRDEARAYFPGSSWDLWKLHWPLDLHGGLVRKLQFPE